ncbi:serine/threonine protein kinase [Cyanobacteria bacterium FACHB-63]|nr:serine/threonine protein kinase [Cyanobacteria bacterium FACHB-63]
MNASNSPASWLGRRLGTTERYRLDQKLGGGAIGDVYLAMDIHLGRRVAIKLLKGALSQYKEIIARFEREVAISAALESEHIVQVLDYGVTPEGNPFYVMEYLQGRTLDQLIRQAGRVSIDQTVQIAIQLCEGLHVAHSGVAIWRNQATVSETVKVVHRDLKPANIYLVPTGLGELAKLLDFGIAKKLHDDTANQTNLTQAFLGTFRYAAPEQLINAAKTDGRADIYSLGMILYEMLTGTNPYNAKPDSRRAELFWATAHASSQPIPLRQQPGCEQIPAALEAIVMRCLNKRPSDRFATVAELRQALQSVVDRPHAQSPVETVQSNFLDEPTIHKPLVAHPDETIAQAPRLRPDSTIVQPKVTRPDVTIVQSPKPSNPSDSTIVQASGKILHPDATVASTLGRTISRPREMAAHRVPESTIVQSPPRIYDATVVEPNRQTSKPSSSQTLLMVAIGFLLGLGMMGGLYLCLRPQLQPQQQSTR